MNNTSKSSKETSRFSVLLVWEGIDATVLYSIPLNFYHDNIALFDMAHGEFAGVDMPNEGLQWIQDGTKEGQNSDDDGLFVQWKIDCSKPITTYFSHTIHTGELLSE